MMKYLIVGVLSASLGAGITTFIMTNESVEVSEKKELSIKETVNDDIEVLDVETGYKANDFSMSFHPFISVKFKNNSDETLSTKYKIKAIFIDNTTGEQLDEDFEVLASKHSEFLAGAIKTVTLESYKGISDFMNADASIKLSIDGGEYETYEIERN